ncbi:MAG: NAD-glutamate dehydrogenase [Mesorhizobium amorphae]|nr:MAG: NAD-glutamate dehydrogenase [Mesorhizobium amorphae]
MAASVRKKTGKAAAPPSEERALRDLLIARGATEDLRRFTPDALDEAARLAEAALKRHRPGESVIAIDRMEMGGVAHSVVSVVNDNMPFLFDSVLGEATEAGGEPRLVLHPVLLVRHDRNGVSAVLGDAKAAKGEAAAKEKADKASLIQIHLPLLRPEAEDALRERLERVLAQVRAAVSDWKAMLARLDAAISAFRYGDSPLDRAEVQEAVAFLEWLRDDNFTFLGMREFRFSNENGTFGRTEEPGLGILRDPDVLVLRRDADGASATPEVRAFLLGPDPLIVSKANTRSLVHRRAYLDYVGVKLFAADGTLSGELRIVGLFTSTAYTRSVFKIPFLRSKAEAVIAKSGFDRADHSGKALVNVLESYPRDELFQVPVPLLRRHAETILALGERPRVRVLVRPDSFDRFVSVIVFVPRDRYDSVVREKIGEFLKTAFEGRVSAFYPAFPEGSLARVHFIIGRSGGRTPKPDTATLEAGVRAIVRTWDDALREAAALHPDGEGLEAAARFPASYRDTFAPGDALTDARVIAGLTAENPIALAFRRDAHDAAHAVALKIFHLGEPVSLSRRVPMLENLGFRVVSEQTFALSGSDGAPVFLHDMELESASGGAVSLSDGGDLIESVFLAVWEGASDNDALNALVQGAGLDTTAIGTLRAYSRYLQQAGLPQSQDYVAATLNRYPAIARGLWDLFQLRLDPSKGNDREALSEKAAAALRGALDAVPSLDDDTILRRMLALIEGTLRTNLYAPLEPDRSLALKFDAQALSFLPEPRPWREIFVFGPAVEGVHLRFGPVARGGLRWSDRAQDYRTEVLGLVKAQQVKNAVIVPVGAKGGFFPKRLPDASDREAWAAAGKAAYVNFVSTLLSITDNLEGDRVVPPEGVFRHDGDDPYFVVAADKGTATFSDTANAIAQAHGFWLDDAFASGGSAGYDHKKMGITARGAWEAVKRHFREMDRDIQTTPFTVVGVGDMGGDVFGNGMLLSEQTRLVAAFDHRHIFLDPEPDPAVSFAERQRLFALPRSSWADYDRAKLSAGGAIVARSEKSIRLSPEAAASLGLETGAFTPQALISAILKAPVDLLWFGGIGTYVKASGESNADAGDRANDAVRISALDLRAKVIGEGANLAVTERGRIEYNLRGGRCNSDAIDNSGGVNSSDVEVNIKIALARPMREGRLERTERDTLLAAMTDEVAELVLANNYGQTLAISLLERRGLRELPHLARLMNDYERRGLLDRQVEALPDATALADRQARGHGLTRAELGVLLAYGKIVLFADLLKTELAADPAFRDDLFGYFPKEMHEGFAGEIENHRLRAEIICRVLVNDLVNRGGPAMVSRLGEATGAGPADTVRAFAAARDGFGFSALYEAVDALDNRIDGTQQLDLYGRLSGSLERITGQMLKSVRGNIDVAAETARLAEARETLEPELGDLASPDMQARAAEEAEALEEAGVPSALARALAAMPLAERIPEIMQVANEAGTDLVRAARAFFAVSALFRVSRIEEAARSLEPADAFDALALQRASDAVASARRSLAVTALCREGDAEDCVAAWAEAGGARLEVVRERIANVAEGGEPSLSRLTVAAGLMSDLAALPVRAER